MKETGKMLKMRKLGRMLSFKPQLLQLREQNLKLQHVLQVLVEEGEGLLAVQGQQDPGQAREGPSVIGGRMGMKSMKKCPRKEDRGVEDQQCPQLRTRTACISLCALAGQVCSRLWTTGSRSTR